MLRTKVSGIAAVLVAFTLIVIALQIWQGARAATILCGDVVIGAAAWLFWRNMRWRDGWTLVILGAALCVLSIGAVINIHYYTELSGGTYYAPVLQNYDHERYWSASAWLLDGTPLPDQGYARHLPGYAGAVLLWIFGKDVGVLIMFNILCAILSIGITGVIAGQLTADRRVVNAAMICISLICYFMVQATVPIKDDIVALIMAMAALALLRISREERRLPVGPTLLFALALAMMTLYRPNGICLLVIGAAVFSVGGRQRLDSRMLAFICICVGVWGLMQLNPGVARAEEIVNDTYGAINLKQQYTRAWDNIVGEYASQPLWRRLATLPMSVLVQYLIPFPWNFSRDIIFGPALAVAHFGYCWYYAGALVIYYIFAMMRRSPSGLRRLVMWGVLCTFAIAFFSSGRISRYCLPLLPLLMPAAAYVLIEARRRRSLWIWLGVFTLLLMPTLIICHHMQTSLL